MPLFVPVIIGISALLAIGGVAYGCDQENKRKEEQKRARTEIAKLKNQISKLERKHDRLLPVLGKRNYQVRVLAGEIVRLRGELAFARRRAG